MGGDRTSAGGPTLHDHLDLPISLSRWSGHVGYVAGPNVRDKQYRLWIRDAHGERVGFVLNERYLFLQPGWEAVRSEIVHELTAQSVPFISPSPRAIGRWTVRGGLSLWPYAYRNEFHVYHDGPRGAHNRVGIYIPRGRILRHARSQDRDEIRDLLRRTGLLKPGEELAPPRRVVRQRPPAGWDSPPAQTRPRRRRARQPIPTPDRPEPVGEQPPGETDPVWSEKCAFAAVEKLVPPALRERVERRLRAAHCRGHGTHANGEWLRSGYAPSHPDAEVDRGYWGPDGMARVGAGNRPLVGKAAYPGPRRDSGEWQWPADVDDWVDRLIERYDGFFPAVAAYRARLLHPELWSAAREARASLHGKQVTLDWINEEEGSTAWLLACELWWRTRERRTWPAEASVACPICGERFDPRSTDLWHVLRFRANRWCPACRSALFDTNSRQYLGAARELPGSVAPGDPLLDEAVRFLAQADGPIPQEVLAKAPALHDRDAVDADRWLLARVAGPTEYELHGVAGSARWTSLLQRAGVLGPIVRRERGTSVTAADGHPCRSMFELAIDDFLSSRAIPHEIEPAYPYHPVYNPGGRRRADWLLPGRVVVEAAGMADEDYLARLDEKAQLVADLGLRLIVVRPGDVSNLEAIFADVIGRTGEDELLPLTSIRAR